MKIREALKRDAAGVARVQVDAWRITYRGIVPHKFLDEMSPEKCAERWFDFFQKPDLFGFVAENEAGEIVGFCAGGPVRANEYPDYKGELYAIYILEAYQRMGLGRRLFLAFVEKLSLEEFPSMLIWVLRDNPYRGFYEALGGRGVAEKELSIGEALLPEIGYGWGDLRSLVKELKRKIDFGA